MAASFETIRARTRDFGQNAYLEVALKRLREGDETSEFIVLSRGFTTTSGDRRWTKFVTAPADPVLLRELADEIADVAAELEHRAALAAQ